MSPSSEEFQCIICFDDFDHEEKPPVVLPCGHTHVCEPCAKRLKRCMECRTSLFISTSTHQVGRSTPPSPTAQTRYNSSPRYRSISASSSFGNPNRYGAPPAPPSPKAHREVEQVPLPLPKNLVLLDLIDEKTKKDEREVEVEENAGTEPDDGLLSTCGTYEVRDRDGLQVFTDNPSDVELATGKNSNRKGFWRMKKKKASSVMKWPTDSLSSSNRLKDEKRRPRCVASIMTPRDVPCDSDTVQSSVPPQHKSYHLEYGQFIQVVHISKGVAKLSRGMGYVAVDSTQLVRVGDAQDTVCELEGNISEITSEREKLHKRLLELDEMERKLEEDIKTALIENDRPVTASVKPEDSTKDVSILQFSSQKPSSPQAPQVNIGGRESPRSSEPGAVHSFPKLPTLAKDSLSNGSASISKSFDDDNIEVGCVDRLLGLDQTNQFEGHRGEAHLKTPVRNPSDYVPPRTTADWVDFRTGLSGHHGLNSPRRTFVDRSPSSRGEIRMMSEHKGASHIKPIPPRSRSAVPPSPPRIIPAPTW